MQSRWPAPLIGVIAAGGAAGTLLRAFVAEHLPHPAAGFPWATFWVNVAGCALLGFVAVAAVERFAESSYLRPLLGTGLCGGLTTFSTWVVEVDLLVKGGHIGMAGLYTTVSVAAGLVAVRLGMVTARATWGTVSG